MIRFAAGTIAAALPVLMLATVLPAVAAPIDASVLKARTICDADDRCYERGPRFRDDDDASPPRRRFHRDDDDDDRPPPPSRHRGFDPDDDDRPPPPPRQRRFDPDDDR